MFIAKFGGVINNFLVLIGSTQLEKKRKKKKEYEHPAFKNKVCSWCQLRNEELRNPNWLLKNLDKYNYIFIVMGFIILEVGSFL